MCLTIERHHSKYIKEENDVQKEGGRTKPSKGTINKT